MTVERTPTWVQSRSGTNTAPPRGGEGTVTVDNLAHLMVGFVVGVIFLFVVYLIDVWIKERRKIWIGYCIDDKIKVIGIVPGEPAVSLHLWFKALDREHVQCQVLTNWQREPHLLNAKMCEEVPYYVDGTHVLIRQSGHRAWRDIHDWYIQSIRKSNPGLHEVK